MFNYEAAQHKIKEGQTLTRAGWGACKTIRLAKDSDQDYVGEVDLEGLTMEDCATKICDCKIGIFHPTEEDKKAEDYIIV